MLKFSNPGEIDIRAITTLGVNVKEGGTPIGYFGTGLKYAIAALLRLRENIVIFSGESRFDFGTAREVIRGKEFEIVTMNETALGFTTEFGKNWKPWMLYRELASNTIDEGGEIEEDEFWMSGEKGKTNIFVTGLSEWYVKREEIFFDSTSALAEEGLSVEFSLKSPGKIFYRGIKVGEVVEPCRYSFNLKGKHELTEDRTLKDVWLALYYIKNSLARTTNAELIKNFLLGAEGTFERSIDWGDYLTSETFDLVAARLIETDAGRVNPSIWRRIEKMKGEVEPREMELNGVQRMQLDKALDFLEGVLEVEDVGELRFAEDLGKGVLGIYRAGVVYISKLAFDRGTKCLAGTIFEEWLHKEKNFDDESRAMQNWLIDSVMSLGERLRGKPL